MTWITACTQTLFCLWNVFILAGSQSQWFLTWLHLNQYEQNRYKVDPILKRQTKKNCGCLFVSLDQVTLVIPRGTLRSLGQTPATQSDRWQKTQRWLKGKWAFPHRPPVTADLELCLLAMLLQQIPIACEWVSIKHLTSTQTLTGPGRLLDQPTGGATSFFSPPIMNNHTENLNICLIRSWHNVVNNKIQTGLGRLHNSTQPALKGSWPWAHTGSLTGNKRAASDAVRFLPGSAATMMKSRIGQSASALSL